MLTPYLLHAHTEEKSFFKLVVLAFIEIKNVIKTIT